METLFGSARQKLEIEEIISCLTDKPKKRFDLPVSAIEKDIKANLTLFDPDMEYVFEHKNILSKSKNSAFLGKSLKGKIYGIISNNKLVLN
jgi:dihydroorotase